MPRAETGADGVGGIINAAAIHMSAPPPSELGRVEIDGAAEGDGSWLGREGGTVIVRSPPGGGRLLITAYGADQRAVSLPDLIIHRLDRPRSRAPSEQPPTQGPVAPSHSSPQTVATPLPAPQPEAVPPSMPEPMLEPELAATVPEPGIAARSRESELPEQRIPEPAAAIRVIPIEIGMHVGRIGDRRVPGDDWVSVDDADTRIEAIAIHPMEALSPLELEYKVFGPDGRETYWISEGKWCGTRGRATPLTGFAVRVTEDLADRFAVEYEARFFSGEKFGPVGNGTPCLSPIDNDPLQAIKLRIVERSPGTDEV